MSDNHLGVPGTPSSPRTGGDGGMLDRAGEIFLTVRELTPVARDQAIDRLCEGTIELKKLVLLLLRGDNAPLPVESLADDIRAACDTRPSTGHGILDQSEPSLPSEHIGNYRILERLGEGGFGIVYMAEQERPVRRRVALKIIKLGMDTRQVVARFEAERQALALMDHPNIAKVFDAGATDTGRPYFVMELVRGLPITQYCDSRKLSIRQRLELIAQVCNALQHAHQKGVIHRDIKPSNVLVEGIDGSRDQSAKDPRSSSLDPSIPGSLDPYRVKIIDFGIAKATSARLTEKTIFTEFRQMIGTPEYMSPEQAGESSEDVDTRTDVYSTGVLLYELLTGATPFDSKRLRSAAFGEMQRIIREEEPPAPSVRVSPQTVKAPPRATESPTKAPTHDPDRAVFDPSRHDSPPSPHSGTDHTERIVDARILKGELDWIVMKSLEKDRSRRYESAGAMAADIQRYLTGHAVQAAPPSQTYLARKFIRRNKGPVLAGALLSLSLVAGLVGTSLGFYDADQRRADAVAEKQRADDERSRADEQRDRAITAEARTKQQAGELRRVADFQTSMLSQVDLAQAGLLLKADITSKYEAALTKGGVTNDHGERASQVQAFAIQWNKVNATDAARELINSLILKPAVSAIDRKFADQPLLDATLRETIAQRYQELGLYDISRSLQERVVSTRQRELGPEHPDTLNSIVYLARLQQAQGQFTEAESKLRAVVATCRRVLGDSHPGTIIAINSLGDLLQTIGNFPEAETCLRESVEKSRKVLGPADADTLRSINSLGLLLMVEDKPAEAEPYLREAESGMRHVLGDEHPDTLTAMCNLGLFLKRQGRLDEAEPFLRGSLEKRRRIRGEEHPETLMSLNNLGTLLLAQHKLTEAEPYLREALEKRRQTSGEEDPETLASMCNLGALLKDEGKLPEAEAYFREALEKQRRVLDANHPATLASISNLGATLREQKKFDEAEPYLREALAKRTEQLGPAHQSTLVTAINLGGLLLEQGKYAEAVSLLAPVEAAARQAFTGGNISRLATFLITLGQARSYPDAGNNECDKAQANLLEARDIFVQTRGETHKSTLACVKALVDLYTRWNAIEPNKGYDTKAAEWQAKLTPAPVAPLPESPEKKQQ